MRFAYTLAALSAAISAAFATDIDVEVGANGKLLFSPEYVQAKKGDIVRFHFNPKAHSVTQSSFNTPCIKSAPGFLSGFDTDLRPVSPDQVASNQRPFNDFFVLDDSKPLWFYCKQVGHCGQGMVFAINPPATGNTFEAFKALAIKQNGTATSTTSSVANSATSGLATPKLCAAKDDNASPLTQESGVQNGFVTCTYTQAGACVYFANGGTFSSGSSVCPDSVPGQSNGSNVATAKLCAAKDNAGSPLTKENDPSGGFVDCVYQQAGTCEYFASSGGFSSGSSVCPSSVPGTAGANKVNAVSGAISDNDDDDSSLKNIQTLITNSYIIIGLTAAVLIALIAVAMVTICSRKGLRGREAKYSKVTVPKAFQGVDEEASMTHQRYGD